MASDPLNVDNLLNLMKDALPTHPEGDVGSDISSIYEAIALFGHACMTAVGFRLIGFKEGQKKEADLAATAPRLTSEWNSSFGTHSFLYAHSQSSMEYLLKIDRMGSKAEIRGIGLGDERIARFEITAKDYISSSALPIRISITDGVEDRSDLPAKFKDFFISESRIKDLAALFKTQIIQPLLPGLQKEGYEETQSAAAREARDDREEAHARRNPRQDPLADPGLPAPARPQPFNDPLALPPRRGPYPDFAPPGFEDEYELQRPGRGGLAMPDFGGLPRPLGGGGRNPYGIGGDDLNPPGLGPHDPLRPAFVPGPGGFGGGGMHPTFDDPLFGGRGQGGRGGDGQHPDGARWDPVGPGEGPRDRMGRGGFPGGGQGPNQGGFGGPPNPFGGFGRGDFL